MPRFTSYLTVAPILVGLTVTPLTVSFADFNRLEPDQSIAAFRTEAVYEDHAGQSIGARFRHAPTGFVLDLLRIQSLPQAFMWVNSPPPSDQGEPHTCEHLLLGKGTKGRYVASLEDMSLGSSSAFTMQLQTCYHYHTAAGTDVFFQLMEAQLDAMLHPNFSDEEIRREVCNIGYSIDPADSSLRLEEKGTVYNEMVSSFERPWSVLGTEIDRMLYGPEHPLSYSSGGIPAAIRTMTTEDMRTFHRENYRLGNMGMIVSLPNDVGMNDALTRISALLGRVQPEAELGADPTRLQETFPSPRMAPEGEVRTVYFPHQNPEEPGLLVYAWAPTRDLNAREMFLLELLVDNLAGGETSDLYREFIDSKTRSVDLGANAVFGWTSSDLGQPLYIGFNNVGPAATEPSMIDSVRRTIRQHLTRIADWADGSAELAAFNERIQNRLLESRRSLRKFLNSPPGFGFRGTGAGWFEHLKQLQMTEGFRKRLTRDGDYDYVEDLLASGQNFWRAHIESSGLLKEMPYAVAARPDPTLIESTESERRQRIQTYVASLRQRYGVNDDQEAMSRYRAEYDTRTAEIEAEARTIPMPGFVQSPPLTLDDQLDYAEASFGAVPFVVSRFDNISSATAGLAMRLDVLPDSRMLYIPALPTLLTDVGVIVDGEPIPYDVMKQQLRREILSLNAYFSTNHRTQRAELVIKASGSDVEESRRALHWLDRVLFAPDWRPENLGRIRDAIDLTLKSRRNTMRFREEAWVQDPQQAYWRQDNPRLLLADCFLTQVHALHRLRWLLKAAPTPEVEAEVTEYLKALAGAPATASRDELQSLLTGLSGSSSGDASGAQGASHWVTKLAGLSEEARELVGDAASDLKQSLADIPESNLAIDWEYLCTQMARDLAVEPEQTLEDLHNTLARLRHTDNTRGFLTASSNTQESLEPDLTALTGRLDARPSERFAVKETPVVLERLRQRHPGLERPAFVGLVNDNTRSGVFVNTTPCASYEDTDAATLLKFLSARLYGGGGAHSMFMKTWGAGLAYSNGLRSNENTGRLIYYAERCPDLAQTMQFVVNELKNAPYDTTLAEYAVAQAFSGNRAGRRYEDRGEAMASDLADGLTPDVVKRFRRGILALRDTERLYDELHARMEATYGEVLPGYGPRASETPEAIHYVIGPESQFESLEQYLRSVEGPDARLYRLYPRDYWLTPSE